MEKEILTVGDLRKALTGVPDNMPVRFFQDQDGAYGACCDACQDSFIYFKDEDEQDEFLESGFDANSYSESDINDKIPCFLIYIENHDFGDFDDNEYYIRKGVKIRKHHDKNERS